jgi:signal transduction histidine kinase
MSVSRPRASYPIVLGATAVAVLLGLLGSLQYRWLGKVSEAEEARLRAAARARAEPVARELDRELTRAFLLLQVDAASVRGKPAAAFAERYARWKSGAAHPALVKDVFVAKTGSDALLRFDPETSTFVAVAWPAELASVRERSLEPGPPGERGRGRGPGFFPPFEDELPALVLPIAASDPAPAPGTEPRGLMHVRVAGLTIVLLDRDYLVRRLLPELVARHFGPAEQSEYAVVVRRRADPATVVFRSGPDPRTADAGDARVGLFELRFEDASEEDLKVLPSPRGAAVFEKGDRRRFWVRRGGEGPHGESGRWELTAFHREGSLAEIVAATRHRNLLVSAGILLLLAASAVLIVVSAQRARRLADRQLDFVAGVSHELRTPLAVIGSAAENLADGVVTEAVSVRQYGRVIRDEGRRLGEMVEQVLELAGALSGRGAPPVEDVEIAELVDEALRSTAAYAPSLRVERNVAADLPPLRADRGALVRALRNLVENAAKHGGEGGAVTVRASRDRSAGRDEVRIAVEDHGPGIPPEERPYLFEPFFRGQRARERQVRGSGLGLSLVDRIVRAAGGRVEVDAAAQGGAVFTIVLPAADDASRRVPASEPSHGTPNPAR